MSNEFALPIAINLAPRQRIAAVVTALHCLPLPLLWVVGGAGAWVLAAAVAVSLALELRRQRRAGAAARLEATAANRWLLYRGGGGGGGAPGGKIELIDGADCGPFALLLVAQHGRRFHLLAAARAQPGEQWHRLRVWLAHRAGAP